RDAFSLPVASSQSFRSPGSSGRLYSPVHEASSLPSGEKAVIQTRSLWPSSTARCLPEGQSWRRITLSSQARASCLPSGERLTLKTTLFGTGSAVLRPCGVGSAGGWAAASSARVSRAAGACQARGHTRVFAWLVVMVASSLEGGDSQLG